MRWSIIRTIWFRELRDQLRDRRTLLVILGLPLILYPLLGFAVVKVAFDFTDKPSVVGVVTGSPTVKVFPARHPPNAGLSVAPILAWLSAAPGGGVAHWTGACSLAQASHQHFDYPLLIDGGTFDSRYLRKEAHAEDKKPPITLVFLDKFDPGWQNDRKLDLILETPQDFFAHLEHGEDGNPDRPAVLVHPRADASGQFALQRLAPLMDQWKNDLRKVRLARRGLTEQFLDPYEMKLPEQKSASTGKEAVANLIIRFFPLMLVMWSLSGALYPAIDLCAGEKERGTMETLLITPAGREEIVMGKFLTIWVFSSATALMNLLSMGITTASFGSLMPEGGLSLSALFWCVILSLPQSAFFSALSLAIGAYARSSKEGQYYLLPLFIVTMPLICLTLVPGVELNPLYSMVPVTGVALLMQKLMTTPSVADIPYFVAVLGPMALYSWLALRWAIEQFNREDVLFREAERLDWVLWFKRLLRDKEVAPTTGEAFFCLALLIGLRWLTMGIGNRWSLQMYTAITQLAFVAMPALFMVLLLTTHPEEGLYLRWPRGRETWVAVLLALLLLPAMTGLTQAVALWFPHLLEGKHPLVEILRSIHEGPSEGGAKLMLSVMAYALFPALCEEIAFRGLILRGLHQGFRPRNAVLLSSFAFALFHLNVFLFAPTFLLGVILGLLTVRSRSLLPAILFHLLHNTVLIALIPLSEYREGLPGMVHAAWPWFIGVCVAIAAAIVWWLYRKPYVDLARREAEEAAAAARELQERS